jgi:oligopeptide transport system substrate-binding protein
VTRPARTFGLLATCALLFAGCGADPYPGQPEEGTLRVPLITEMKGFDPTQADEETTSTMVVNIYDQLYEYHHLKRPFELVPCLAASMPEISADGLTQTIRLKQGVRYCDDPCFPDGKGREVVASDVVFCLKRFMDGQVNSPGVWLIEGRIDGLDEFHDVSLLRPKNAHRSAYPEKEVLTNPDLLEEEAALARRLRDSHARRVAEGSTDPERHVAPGYPPVPGLAAPDPHTVVIRLTKPFAELMWVLAMAYTSVYPPEAVAAYGNQFAHHPVTSGPYVLESYARAQKAVLVRNPNYRDDEYPREGTPGDEAHGRLRLAGQKLPANDRVIATVFVETPPMWLYFESGFLDRTGIPKDNFASAIDPETKSVSGLFAERDVRLERDPRLEIIYDCFNFRDPVVGAAAGERGRALRRAMSLATDEAYFTKYLYNDRVSRVEGPIIAEFPEFDPAFVNPWKRRADETYEQALERGKQVMAEAGMPGGQGVPDLLYETGDSTLDEQFYLAFRTDMARLGLRVTPYRATWQEQMARQRTAKFQISGVSWGADYPVAQNFLQLFYGPNRAPNSNSSNYENPVFDQMYDKALALPPGPERTALYREMQRIVVDDAVWIFRYRREQWGVKHHWLEGYRYNDISPKYFKYCRARATERSSSTTAWNPVRRWPGIVALGVLAAFVVGALFAARRQVKGW